MNGDLSFQSYEEGQWPEKGAVVSYTCYNGFVLEGPNVARCNGMVWTGAPRCIEEPNCGLPLPAPPNSYIFDIDLISPDGKGRPQDYVEYRCNG